VQLIAFCFCFLECVKFYLYAQVLHKFISQKTLSWVKDATTTTTTTTTQAQGVSKTFFYATSKNL